MSLYDKYFSDVNRNHIYSLLCTSIHQDFGYNVANDRRFKERYNQIYPQIFRETDTDNLVELNKALVDRMAVPMNLTTPKSTCYINFRYNFFTHQFIFQ